MNALACGATVMGSDTAPVREMIQHGKNGLRFDFFEIEQAVETANHVLDFPAEYEHLGAQARARIVEQYSLDVCLPKMLELYQSVKS